MTMRVAIVNLVWTRHAATADALLDRYHTLTGWASAVAAAGAEVTVIQRWREAERRQVGAVRYVFVHDAGGELPGADTAVVSRAMADAAPEVVHVNGVVFANWCRRIEWPATSRVVVQDHGGWHPERASWWSRRRVRLGLSRAHALLVCSAGQAAAWRRARAAPPTLPIRDVVEASSGFVGRARDEARSRTPVRGRPAVLWVGRTVASKDPLTALEGFARFRRHSPDACLTMVGPAGPLESLVRRRMADGDLRDAVARVTVVNHADMPDYYSAADLLLSASRFEGSGYAVIEAMACGLVPVITSIAPFLALSGGRIGAHWPPGHVDACAAALARAAADTGDQARQGVRARFDEAASWPVIGARAVAIYRDVLAR